MPCPLLAINWLACQKVLSPLWERFDWATIAARVIQQCMLAKVLGRVPCLQS